MPRGAWRVGAGMWAAVCLIAGCRGGPGAAGITDEFFFPSANEPHMQYLRSFNGSPDFVTKSFWGDVLEYFAGAEERPQYELEKPFSVASHRGKVYVTDSFGPNGLSVFDIPGNRFYVLGITPGPGQLRKPINVFIDQEGYKYVSDLVRRQVVVFDTEDKFARTYGDGTTFKPVACVVDNEQVFVLDIDFDEEPDPENPQEKLQVRRDQILVLDKVTGKALRRIGGHGRDRDGMNFASFMAIDRRGDLYVGDALNYRVLKLDDQGRVLASFGRHGDQPGDFVQIKGVAVDREGLIYVVDTAFQVAQVFDNGGRPLFHFGGPRVPQGAMDLPAGIWIDYESAEYFEDYFGPDFKAQYVVLVANQLSKKHRVTVYAYGKSTAREYPPEQAIRTLDGDTERKVLWEFPVVPVKPNGARG